MILVLLLFAGLVLGGIGFGVYLLVRPDPPAEASPPPGEATDERTDEKTDGAPPSGSPSDPPANPPNTVEPDPGPGTGSGSTSVGRPDESGQADPNAVARDYVDAVNARDETAATGLTCARAEPGTLFSATDGRDVVLGDVAVLGATVASATVLVGDAETALLLENQEDGWCVAI